MLNADSGLGLDRSQPTTPGLPYMAYNHTCKAAATWLKAYYSKGLVNMSESRTKLCYCLRMVVHSQRQTPCLGQQIVLIV